LVKKSQRFYLISEKDKSDWIQLYGEIAINGGEKEVERFLDSLKRFV